MRLRMELDERALVKAVKEYIERRYRVKGYPCVSFKMVDRLRPRPHESAQAPVAVINHMTHVMKRRKMLKLA